MELASRTSDVTARAPHIQAMLAQQEMFANLHHNLKAQFAATRDHLVNKNLAVEILSRHDEFTAQYETQASKITTKQF